MNTFKFKIIAVLAAAALALPCAINARDILNTSYDLSRELFPPINKAFIAHWQATKGETVTIRQSHAGSSRQARAILEGLQSDVVTFNQSTDVQLLADNGLVAADWPHCHDSSDQSH